jgi:hypothetical protein
VAFGFWHGHSGPWFPTLCRANAYRFRRLHGTSWVDRSFTLAVTRQNGTVSPTVTKLVKYLCSLSPIRNTTWVYLPYDPGCTPRIDCRASQKSPISLYFWATCMGTYVDVAEKMRGSTKEIRMILLVRQEFHICIGPEYWKIYNSRKTTEVRNTDVANPTTGTW